MNNLYKYRWPDARKSSPRKHWSFRTYSRPAKASGIKFLLYTLHKCRLDGLYVSNLYILYNCTNCLRIRFVLCGSRPLRGFKPKVHSAPSPPPTPTPCALNEKSNRLPACPAHHGDERIICIMIGKLKLSFITKACIAQPQVCIVRCAHCITDRPPGRGENATYNARNVYRMRKNTLSLTFTLYNSFNTNCTSQVYPPACCTLRHCDL